MERLTAWTPDDRAEVSVGQSLSALSPQTRMRVDDPRAVVTALDRTAEYTPHTLGKVVKFHGLIQVAPALPEGTVLFKDGKLVGVVLLGRRFLGRESETAYLLPAKRFAELCEKLTTNPTTN